MALIKSYSNYTLKKRHQEINGGTIYERDITTVGGLDTFGSGQVPVYKSGNFLITVRNDGRVTNQYNRGNWEESASGNVWTLENISGMTSELEDDNDLKIVLKQDYYDLNEFAYYGSLTELFRASVNDIVSRFPGELYGTHNNVYCTSAFTEDGETIQTSVVLGGENCYEISNPFGINMHTVTMPKDVDKLKYFADSGFTQYELISGETTSPITQWDVEYYYSEEVGKNAYKKYSAKYTSKTNKTEINSSDTTSKPYPCKGDVAAIIKLNNTYEISGYVGDNSNIFYLYSGDTCNDLHIRPKKSYIGQFYNECDNFEKLLMNPKTTPRYTATFSVIKENDFGYYRELETFTFPTTYGDYNIDATDYGFNEYTNKMIEVGEFYDERFSDNIWRSMTHEAIKNFDWTYTREFEEGDEEEYVLGGERMQKALRVFAREFDEIISYIENIKSVNNVTYDERDNIPDYFLTDVVENEGWNVELIYPYELNEYYYDYSGTKKPWKRYFQNDQLTNTHSGFHLIREFSQNSTIEVKPYANDLLGVYKNGYFIICSGCTGETDTVITGTSYDGTKYKVIVASSTTRYDGCAFGGRGVLKDRIRPYSDEKTYSYKDVNNEFLRRLKINSKPIWRHKGTVEGIEMILGMFGLRSKRFNAKRGKDDCDYEVVEYTSFAPYINDWWDAVHQMYRIDWINSTKAINYVDSGVEYVSYQGIPVAYKEIENSYIDRRTNSSTTTDPQSAYTRSDGSYVLERRLYPNFNKGEQYDGNPYFQMDGGWLSKTIASANTSGVTKKYNFQYDVDNNIVYTDYEISGKTDESGFTIDNEFLYKETVRNIRRTDNVRSLLKTPTYDLTNGCVFYVTNVEENILVVDGDVFDVIDEYSGGTESDYKVLHCVELIKDNGYIRVGDKYFDESICVYDKDWQLSEYSLNDKPDGYSVYAYLSGTTDNFNFNCSDYSDSAYSIESYTYMNGTTEDDTNYFVLDDINYSYNIAKEIGGDDVWTSGWRRLKKTNKEYLKLNTIENYFKGNNPHNGKMVYDNGHEYYTYFKRLFKYPIENDLFDERCYTDYYYTIDNEISKYGFSGLIDDNEDIKQYDINLIEDSKIHYFGNYYSGSGKHVDVRNENLLKYGENGYTLSSITSYSAFTTSDEVTNQIVNNKRLSIKFNLHYKWYTKDGQEEIKYLDTIVMNYLTQMIPSTTILDICYISK